MVVGGLPNPAATGRPTSPACELFLDLAGVGIALSTSCSATAAGLRRRFGGFTGQSHDARLSVEAFDDSRDLPPPPGIDGHGEPTRIEGDGYAAAIDWSARRARVAGPAAPDGVEAVMRLALPHVLHDGLLVHGAVLSDGTRSFLCVGPSGSGKSTLAQLVPDRALGDELAIVRHAADSWIAGSFPTASSRPGSLPLARIFFLRHAPSHERRRLPAARAAGRLAEQSHWLTDDPERGRRSFDLVTRIAGDVPAFDLGFTPDPAVWDVMAAQE